MKRPSSSSPADSPAPTRPRLAAQAPTLVPCEGLGSAGQLKLREQNKLIDVTLKVGAAGTELRAHRMVLALASPYLEGLLAGQFAESRQDTVELKDLDGAAVAGVIDACYTGVVAMTLTTASGVLRAANALQIGAVEAAAAGWIAQQLSVDTAAQWMAFAADYARLGKHGQALLEKCLKFTAAHFVACAADEAFVDLPAEVLEQLLRRADVEVGDECEVLAGLRTWWDHDAAGRTAALPQLLPCVRLPLLGDEARLAVFGDSMVAALADLSQAGRELSFRLLRECAKQFDATPGAWGCPRLWPRTSSLSAPQRAALAQAERATAGALLLEGHPRPAVNGVYRRVGQELHEGWPRYKHASNDACLYRYQKAGQWRVMPGWEPSRLDICAGTVASEGGPVPVGAQQWRCVGDDGEWSDGTVTVRELTDCP
jgi:hypothetical protein